MSLWITDTNVSPPAWYSSAGIWSLPRDLYFFSFAIEIWTSRWLGPGTSGSAVCISICLTSLTSWTYNNWDLTYIYIFASYNTQLQYQPVALSLQFTTALLWLLLELLELSNCGSEMEPFIRFYPFRYFFSLSHEFCVSRSCCLSHEFCVSRSCCLSHEFCVSRSCCLSYEFCVWRSCCLLRILCLTILLSLLRILCLTIFL
jgi:hypothetical protein